MLLFVGLGNPGRQYAGNRHNIGFMALEAIARRHGFSTPRARFSGLVSEGNIAGEKVLLLAPQTYMNESGRSVGEAARFHKIPVGDVIVFHDELDLAPAKCRIKLGGGVAGHN
ncbi:MAG: aminoacyl-tRNA hydrolase, partial [Methylocystis sp.]|nr:aminoacyl-tRNA hydrolase [Methylocystis sp.]